MLWGGRNNANKYHWHVWGVLAVSRPHWLCPCSWHMRFPTLHFSGSKLLCRELSEAGPGLHALPRSKLLRFRFSYTLQRHRVGWACILCPSQFGAAQATKCLVNAHSPGGAASLTTYPPPLRPGPSCSASWVRSGSAISGVPCVSSG